MTIGFDGSRTFTDIKTGTENYSYQLLLHLSKLDKKNEYIIYLRPQKGDIGWWPKNFKFKTIAFPRLWTQVGLAIQTFKDPLDLLFVPAHTLPIIRDPSLKTVVTVHDLGSEYLPKTHQLKQRLYLSFMQRYQLKTANKIIAVSKSTKDDLVKRVGLDPSRINVIYEGYNQDLFKSIKNDLLINSLIHYALRPQSYFLFVGTIQPRKNLEKLIRAFALFQSQVNKVSLVIGGAKGWLSDEIYQLPARLGIDKRVKFLGYVPNKDLPILYSGAKALLFPSLFEGFGLPILEAQACGCPVLTSNISSMPEVAGKGAIFVNPYNIDDIVKGMRRMEDRRLRAEIIQGGFENIKKFSWEKCARETLRVLQEI